MKQLAVRVAISVSVVAVLVPAIAVGQPAGEASREVQAQMMEKLWLDTCAKHFTNPEALRAAARSFRLKQDPPYSTELLSGNEGTVWDASLGSQAQFSVLLLRNGTCKVMARRAASGPVIAAFEKVVQGIKTPGVSVERVVDKEVEQAGHKFRQIAYFLSRTGADNGWSFVTTVSESEEVPLQATISIGRSTKP
jgi:hypothetical protein